MKELQRLLEIMKSLRDPDKGCPWDREQTINSIKGYTLEEAYEVVDAIERNAINDLRDELGDLLFHIVFYSEMADEQGDFDFRDVIETANSKLERRHPHVFSDLRLENSEQVKKLWEKTKQQERSTDKPDNDYFLDDISRHLPAMLRACKLQKRAASVGFDWAETKPILEKIEEELDELKETLNNRQETELIAEELGDLMFCCINLARHLHIDPELALRNTNEKFIQRFNFIEEQLKSKNITLDAAELEEMDELWNQAKKSLT